MPPSVECPDPPAAVEEFLAARHAQAAAHVTVIENRSGWRLVDWRELYEYRDLFWFLTWRNVRVRYAQSTLGIGWAIIQPLFSMVVFTLIFGVLAKVKSDGAPYAVFSLAALAPWTFFANALTESAQSLVQNANLLSKVYFPRMILPLSAAASKLVDFGIALVMLSALLAIYRVPPNWGVAVLPLLVALMAVTAAGLGLWLTATAIQYRDVQYGMNFGVQLLMYATPVVYPASLVPERYQYFYAINPMVGVIEGFRSALLGTRTMPWDLIAIGSVSAVLIALGGMLYFRSKERLFADVA